MFSYSQYIAPEKVNSFADTNISLSSKKYIWKIKSPKNASKLCTSCNLAVENNKYKEYIEFKGLNLYFKTANKKMLAELLKGRKSGLALEEVRYSPYDCGNPSYYTEKSRRNNQSILNGKVYKPLYKKVLKKRIVSIIKSKRVSYLNRRLARISQEQTGLVEYNILLLKKNKICRVIHYSDYCGEQYFPDFKPDFIQRLTPFKFEMPVVTDTLNFEIKFEKNKFDYNLEDLKPLLGTFKDTRFII